MIHPLWLLVNQPVSGIFQPVSDMWSFFRGVEGHPPMVLSCNRSQVGNMGFVMVRTPTSMVFSSHVHTHDFLWGMVPTFFSGWFFFTTRPFYEFFFSWEMMGCHGGYVIKKIASPVIVRFVGCQSLKRSLGCFNIGSRLISVWRVPELYGIIVPPQLCLLVYKV